MGAVLLQACLLDSIDDVNTELAYHTTRSSMLTKRDAACSAVGAGGRRRVVSGGDDGQVHVVSLAERSLGAVPAIIASKNVGKMVTSVHWRGPHLVSWTTIAGHFQVGSGGGGGVLAVSSAGVSSRCPRCAACATCMHSP
jgi:hypothetical protein